MRSCTTSIVIFLLAVIAKYQISTEGTPSNSMLARMEGVRAPGTSGNTQGVHTLGTEEVWLCHQRRMSTTRFSLASST